MLQFYWDYVFVQAWLQVSIFKILQKINYERIAKVTKRDRELQKETCTETDTFLTAIKSFIVFNIFKSLS